MTHTIEIKFLAQPLSGDTFSYVLKINGATVNYSGSALMTKIFNTQGYPDGIAIGANLAETLNSALANLTAINHYPGINYTVSGNSILVTITYEGSIAVENMAGTNGRITLADYEAGAITFDGGINDSLLRKAFNNDVMVFFGAFPEPLYCDVTSADGRLNLRLYPDPEEKFRINLRPYVSALINTRYFNDTLNADIQNGSEGSFVYNFNNGTYLEQEVTFSIAYREAVFETAFYNLAWFAGVEQPDDSHDFNRNDYFLLTPFTARTANAFYLKYWQGYPFDFALYCSQPLLYLENTTNLMAQTFNLNESMSRIVLSDGRSDETLESLLPLIEGHNAIRIKIQQEDSIKDKFLTLDKVSYRCGIYLKWLNKYGGYSYWLFEDTYTRDRSTKYMGELERDNDNLENTYARAIQIGKESQDTLKVVAELLTEDERCIVEGLLDSPKIYLFTGKPYSRNSNRDWIEVTLKTGNARLKNARQPLTNFTFDLELPQRYTQGL